MTIGERMLKYRVKHNISQKKLADLLSVGPQVVFRAEKGNRMHKYRELAILSKLIELENEDLKNEC